MSYTYKWSPLRSSHKPIDGVVDTPKNAVPPVFHIGDKIRFKSTGEIEKISTISHGGRFINGVNSNDVELIKEFIIEERADERLRSEKGD